MMNTAYRGPRLVRVAAGLAATLALGGALAAMPQASAAEEEAPLDYLMSRPVLGRACPENDGLAVLVTLGSSSGASEDSGAARRERLGARVACDDLASAQTRTGSEALTAAGFRVETEGEGENVRICKINGFPENGCARGEWYRTEPTSAEDSEYIVTDKSGAALATGQLEGKILGFQWFADSHPSPDWFYFNTEPAKILHRTETAGQHCAWHQGLGLAVDWTGTGKDQERVDIMCLPKAAGVTTADGTIDAYLPETLTVNNHTVGLREVPAQHHAQQRDGKPAQWICQIDGFPADGCAEGATGHWEITRLRWDYDYSEERVDSLEPSTPLLTLTSADQVPQGESWTIGARWVKDNGVDYTAVPSDLTSWAPQVGVKEALAFRPEGLDPEEPGTDPTPTTTTATPPTTTPPTTTPTTTTPSTSDPTDPTDPTPTATEPSADPVPADQARARAASWMARELKQANPAHQLKRPAGDAPDWGLTADMVLGLSAAGGYPQTVAKTVAALDSGAASYVDFGGDQVNSSGAAKLLTVAVVAGKDPHAFVTTPGGGKYDLPQVVAKQVSVKGSPEGALVESNGMLANAFGQSYAVIGLSRVAAPASAAAGRAAPAEVGAYQDKVKAATEFLVKQQCTAGNVQLLQTEKGCSDKTPVDIDTTAMAAQAFYAANKAGVPGADRAHGKAVAWLKGAQKPSGAFVGAPDFTPAQNSNSTGLAAAALTSGGAPAEAAKAAQWVTTVQAQCTTPGLGQDLGAVAYDESAFLQGQSEGVGSTDRARDTWRRATAQAVYAFAPTMLADLTVTEGQDVSLLGCDAVVPPKSTDGGSEAGNGPGNGSGDGSGGGTGAGSGNGIGAGNNGGVDPYGNQPVPRDVLAEDQYAASPAGYTEPLAFTGAQVAMGLAAALGLITLGLLLTRSRRVRQER